MSRTLNNPVHWDLTLLRRDTCDMAGSGRLALARVSNLCPKYRIRSTVSDFMH